MSSLNKVMLIGNLGQDPEGRKLPGGESVCNVTLATSEKWKDKNTGAQQEHTEWHRIVFFGRLADVALQYLRKGSKIYVEGKNKTRSWEQDGVKRYTTEVHCHEMKMLDGKQTDDGDSRQQAPASGRGSAPSTSQSRGSSSGSGQSRSSSAPSPQSSSMNFDDDIPF